MVAVAQDNLPRRPMRLQVIQPEKLQDCSTCAMMHRCWDTYPQYVTINLLICRMHRDIDKNKSTAQLLDLLRPKVARIAQSILHMVSPTLTPDVDEVTRDVESAIVEYLLDHYQMGELAYPLYFLFGGKSGVMYRWSLAYAARLRKAWQDKYPIGGTGVSDEGDFEDRLDRLESSATSGMISTRPNAEISEEDSITEGIDQRAAAQRIMTLVDDGISLDLDEYRVMVFCLENVNERGRALNGLHAFMADRLGVARSRVTRLFHDAARQLAAVAE